MTPSRALVVDAAGGVEQPSVILAGDRRAVSLAAPLIFEPVLLQRAIPGQWEDPRWELPDALREAVEQVSAIVHRGYAGTLKHDGPPSTVVFDLNRLLVGEPLDSEAVAANHHRLVAASTTAWAGDREAARRWLTEHGHRLPEEQQP